jgi:hypothetical protein
MPYKFTFDLSKVPRYFFAEIAMVNYQRGMHKTLIRKLQEMIVKFRIQEATGLNFSDALVLLEDFIDLQSINMIERGKFLQTKKRALFLSHCSRKFLDGRCKAVFDPNIPSYICSHCSEDCLISQSDRLAKSKGYDVYVIPGGSCIPKILKNKKYEGVVGVGCGEEMKVLEPLLNSLDVAGQAIPLIKNGCANTIFNVETLLKVL